LASVSDMAQRIVVLAVQGKNAPLSQEQRTSIINEMTQLMTAIDKIAETSKFSDNDLFADVAYSVQLSADGTHTLDFADTAFADFSSNGSGVDLNTAIGAADATDATTFEDVIEEATLYVTTLVTQRSELGAYQNQLEYTVSNLTDLSTNLQAARSRVIDTDYASETAALTRGQILQQAATAMLAQANQMPNVILTLLK